MTGRLHLAAPRPSEWRPWHALFAGITAVSLVGGAAAGVFRRDTATQNVVGFSGMALAIVIAAMISRRGIRPGLSLLSRTRPGARWAWCIAAGLVVLSVCSDAWLHVFHPRGQRCAPRRRRCRDQGARPWCAEPATFQ
jgi:hypothetical protein